jgi:hypothetical protein
MGRITDLPRKYPSTCLYPALPVCFCCFFCWLAKPRKQKSSRLQSELLSALGTRDFFEIKLGQQVLQLPLPPSPELAEARKIRVAEINLEAYSFDNEKLNKDDQQRLAQLSAQLNELVKRGNGAFFDPVKCVLGDVLRENLAAGNQQHTQILLDTIPAYYEEVARRWQLPDRKRSRSAAAESLLVLESLEKMGDQANPARLAVKDFICLCQSAVLAN